MNDRDDLHYCDRPDQRPDLRAGMEALKDRVLTRADTLEADQRALLRVILEQGSSYRQVARLRGEHASTVSRRFRRLLRKLSHATGGKTPIKAGRLAPLDEAILSAYYLLGMNQSRIAARLSISRYRVRKALARFEPPTAQQRGSASSPIASDTRVSNVNAPTAKRSLTVPPGESARSMTVAAQKRRRPCTR